MLRMRHEDRHLQDGHLRDAAPADWPAVLALNTGSVEHLSPMDEARLRSLAEASCYFRVIEVDGGVAGFLMAFRKGASYDGAIFQLFNARAADFVYIDRIVVAPEAQVTDEDHHPHHDGGKQRHPKQIAVRVRRVDGHPGCEQNARA